MSHKHSPTVEHKVATIGVTGRFRAIVHTGHVFDADGAVCGYKEIRRETPFARNTVCNSGFNRMIGATGTTLLGIVAGDGNTAPTVSDLTLASYKGKMSQRTSVVTTIQNDPLVGPLFYRFAYTATFNPGAFGASAVNIAEAGVTVGATFSSMGSTSPLFARGLLRDEFGDPTTVSVDPDEYLDLVWEYTEWVPHDVTGTVSIDVDGVPTDFDYRVRASHLGGYISGGAWQPMSSSTAAADIINFPNTANARWWAPDTGSTSFARGTAAADGTLGAPSSGPTGSFNNNNRPSSMTSSTYVDNSKERSLTLTWGPAVANISGGISTVNIHLGHMMWQVEYDPPLPKVAGKQLSLSFHFSMDNAA